MSEYPPIGKIAVTKSGNRIEVWPCEHDDPDCFTGMMLLPDRSAAQIAVHDVSCLWGRAEIDHFEEPNEKDRALSMFGTPA